MAGERRAARPYRGSTRGVCCVPGIKRCRGLEPIDLVVVNLYPFAKTAAEAKDPYEQAVIEQIDIGGVALIRAASKNFEDVAVLTARSSERAAC